MINRVSRPILKQNLICKNFTTQIEKAALHEKQILNKERQL